ncbi:MAG: D-alanyl-D-alanine carboxypeptidase/D-alanyl-D-alanine-endopeptidase [Chitinophagaceae bacterium]|nr:MAG: D-alanyl-D-alanine carboxypeptidase/D-alanyl-D-alanine-endopeptidase [Chitinophagaceae bacterium]
MRLLYFIIAFLLSGSLRAQPLAERLKNAWERFESDSQLRAGIASLYIVESASGSEVFARNGRVGLAPASSQKVVTAATAYDLLGPDFRYSTRFAAIPSARKDSASTLLILGSGDPSLGSWRYESQKMDSVYGRVARAARDAGWRYFGNTTSVQGRWDVSIIPRGWIWEDIGQYYGAGADVFNWHENQFDLQVTAGSAPGAPVQPDIAGADPFPMVRLDVQATTSAAGTGDNSYFFYDLFGRNRNQFLPIILRGSLGAGKKYTVSGSIPDPLTTFLVGLQHSMSRKNVSIDIPFAAIRAYSDTSKMRTFHTEQSPTLDQLSYWFLRKSINLYGEAFLKTIALRQKGKGDYEIGIGVMKDFWKARGIDPAELAIRDGSGLSPENRVTTRALVQVLQYARKQSWFFGFYNALPEYNGMKLKSGTIGGVKAYCGYHTSKAGVTYTVSFIVNNYNGSEREIVQKMYAVLNELK